MKYTIEKICERYNNGEPLKYVFFWGHKPPLTGGIGKNCLSQWFDCRFTVEGVEYHTAEQYMMAQKALLFGDDEVYKKIMAASDPGAYKALGRKIRNFDGSVWDKKKTDIVIAGNTAKFSQTPELKDYLIKTGSRVLVEASPYDRIWGIGKSEADMTIRNPYNWKGENLLGFCLMEVRDILLEEAE